jgi:hypothetical protein
MGREPSMGIFADIALLRILSSYLGLGRQRVRATVRKKVNMQIYRHGNVLHDIDKESFRVVFQGYKVHSVAVGSTSHGYPHVHTY